MPDSEADTVDSNETLYTLIGGDHSTDGDDQGDLLVTGHFRTASGSHSVVQPSRKGKERKPCKCGSTSHSRVSFHGCPLNKQS